MCQVPHQVTGDTVLSGTVGPFTAGGMILSSRDSGLYDCMSDIQPLCACLQRLVSWSSK